MAASQTLEKHEDSLLLQRKANGKKSNADDPRRPSSSIKSFQKITRKVMSRSSTGADQVTDAHSQKSNAISNGTIKDCHNLVTPPVVACASCENGSRCISYDHTASNTNCMAANNGSAQRYLSESKALDRKSLQTAQSLHPASSKDRAADASLSDHKLVSKHGSSTRCKSSNIKVSHRSSSENLHKIAVPAQSALEELALTTPKSTTQCRIEVASKHRRQNELCMDCKTNIMASVCFINNDGRIAAALTHPLHYCKKPGCAANRGHYPSASIMSKKASVSSRQVPPRRSQPRKNKSPDFAKVGNGSSVRSITASSTQGNDDDNKPQDLIRIEETCMSAAATRLEGDDESQLMTNTDTDPHNVSSHYQIGVHDSSPCRDKDVLDDFSDSENLQCLILRQIEENHGVNSTPVKSSSAAASCLVSDVIHDHDGVDEIPSFERDAAVELQQNCKSLCYHGDNEYSCSEDGTDVTTSPNSLVKGAFDNNTSSCHVEEHVEDKLSQQSSRSSMERMRRKYLETLRDQQEAERVRLRKQEIMARKQAGDWMLDCHMEELLHRLAPNGEARVKVLVEAFETVIHHSDSESSQTHHEEHDQLHDEQEEQHGNVHTHSSS